MMNEKETADKIYNYLVESYVPKDKHRTVRREGDDVIWLKDNFKIHVRTEKGKIVMGVTSDEFEGEKVTDSESNLYVILDNYGACQIN